jgi:hypothetical protein
VSNSMVVISEFLIYCAQQRGSDEEVGSEEARKEEVMIGGTGSGGGHEGDGDGGGDVVLVTTGAVATGSTGVLRDEIEEVVAATPPLRRQAREIGPLLDVEQIRRLVDGWTDVCVICKSRGRSSKDHGHWKEWVCRQGSDERDFAETRKRQVSVVFRLRLLPATAGRLRAVGEIDERLRVDGLQEAAGSTM